MTSSSPTRSWMLQRWIRILRRHQSKSKFKSILLLHHAPGPDCEEEHIDRRGGNPSTTREDGKVSSSLGRAAEPHSLSPQWDFQVKTVFKRSSIWHCYHSLIHLVWRILQSKIYILCSWSWIACSPFNHQINLIHRSFCFFVETICKSSFDS